MATATVRLPRQLDYWSVSITHFFVDFLNSGRNLIVALLALSLGLTNAQVGLTLVVYNVGNALSQPIFGWFADKIGPRWLVLGGIGWMMLFSTITALATDWVALIAITMVGLGSGGVSSQRYKSSDPSENEPSHPSDGRLLRLRPTRPLSRPCCGRCPTPILGAPRLSGDASPRRHRLHRQLAMGDK